MPTHNVKWRYSYEGDKQPRWATDTLIIEWLGSGVKDCEGVEIYEGDIVQLDGRRYTIEFHDGSFFIGKGYHLEQFSIDPSGLKVIGHIVEENEP